MDARITQLKKDHPVLTLTENGVRRELTAEEYEAQIAEWATNKARQEAEDALRDEIHQERQQAVALYGALKAGTATSRQVQGALAYLLRREMTELPGVADGAVRS